MSNEFARLSRYSVQARRALLVMVTVFAVFFVLAGPRPARALSDNSIEALIDRLAQMDGVEVSHEGLTSDAAGNVDIDTLSVSFADSMKATIKGVRVTGFAQGSENEISASYVAIKSLAFEWEPIGEAFVVHDIEFINPRHDFDVAAQTLIDETFTMLNASYRGIKGFSADEIRSARVDMGAALALVPPMDPAVGNDVPYKDFYKNLVLFNFGGGRIERMEIGGYQFSQKIEELDASLEYLPMVTHDIDYTVLEHLLAPSAYQDGKGDEQWVTVQGHSSLEGIVGRLGDISLEMGPITGGPIYMRQLKDVGTIAAFGRLIRMGLEAGSAEDMAPTPEPEDVAAIIGVLDRFRMESMEFSGMRVKGTISEDGKAIDASVGKISFEEFTLAELDDFTIENIDVSYGGRKIVTHELFRLAQVNFVDVNRLAELAFAAMTANNADDLAVQDMVLDFIPQIGLVQARGMRMLAIPGQEISYDLAEFRSGNYIGRIPTQLGLTIENLKVPAGLITDPRAQEVITGLGYEELGGNLSIDLSWDEASQTVTLKNTRLEGYDAATLSLEAEVTGVPREFLENPEDNYPTAMFASLKSAQVSVSDNSLLGRALSMLSAQTGQPPEQLKQMVMFKLSGLAGAFTTPEFSQVVTEAAQAFLEAPDNLSVSVKPPTPVPAMQIMLMAQEPAQLIEILGVEIQANQ